MDSKRCRLLLRDDTRRVETALWERSHQHDEFWKPSPKGKLPAVVGETIKAVKAFGIYFDRYTTSYEFEIDGPVIFIMESGRMYYLFGEHFRSFSVREVAYIDLRYNSIPAKMRSALDELSGHTILDIHHDEQGVLEIELDECITIESWDGILHEFSEISLCQRLQ